MTIDEKIDSFVKDVNAGIPQKRRRQKVELYSEGLKAKISQTDFALDQLSRFEGQTDSPRDSTKPDDFSITEAVEFYCDAFWTFLYSSLDVLAQVINQALKLDLKERKVGFKMLESRLRKKQAGTAIQNKFTQCLNSNAFRNLDKYRNCSTHRRQIYIEEETKTRRGTAGYGSSTTGPVISVIRTLCDNPMDLSPRTSQKRRVPEYMKATRDKIVKQIQGILQKAMLTA